MDLIRLINSLEQIEIRNMVRVRVLDVLNALKHEKITEFNDVAMIPLYVTDKATYEIYDYELDIRNVKTPEKEECILDRTRAKSLNDVKACVLKKLWTCYVEVVDGDVDTALKDVMDYFDYFLNSEEVKETIEKAVGPFDPINLYFESYFD